MKGPLPWRSALGLAAQIAKAVGHAHDSNILHCDIKSSNVMVTSQNQVKVLDFGLSRARQLPGDDGGKIGTLAFMPPERLIDGTLDMSGDIYSVGVTLFEMLTGRRPFSASTELELIAEIIDTVPPVPSRLVPGLPPKVDEIVARALAKDPRQRFQSARELASALEVVLHRKERTWGERAGLALSGVATLGVVILFLGFVSSTAMNVGLGLTGEFTPNLQRLAIVWGARSLTAPLILLATILLGLSVPAIVLRLLYQTVSPLRTLVAPRMAAASTTVGRWLAPPTDTLSQVVLLAQIVLLGVFLWSFWPLIAGVANFMTASAPGSLSELSPANIDTHELYRPLVSILLFFLVISTVTLLSHRRSHGERPTIYSLASFLAIAIGLFLFALPYQVLFQNKAERVLHAGEVCYFVGRNAEGQVRLFCPLAPVRTRAVAANDPGLIRSGVVESVFAPLDRSVKTGQ